MTATLVPSCRQAMPHQSKCMQTRASREGSSSSSWVNNGSPRSPSDCCAVDPQVL